MIISYTGSTVRGTNRKIPRRLHDEGWNIPSFRGFGRLNALSASGSDGRKTWEIPENVDNVNENWYPVFYYIILKFIWWKNETLFTMLESSPSHILLPFSIIARRGWQNILGGIFHPKFAKIFPTSEKLFCSAIAKNLLGQGASPFRRTLFQPCSHHRRFSWCIVWLKQIM